MVRDKSDERFSVELPAEVARACRDEANRNYGGDLSAALSAAVEQWARAALRAQGVAAIKPIDTEPAATRRPTGRSSSGIPLSVDDGHDLIDPHMD